MADIILKKIYIIFIYKYWYYNICKCYFEEHNNYVYSYLFTLLQNFPHDIVPIVPNIGHYDNNDKIKSS